MKQIKLQTIDHTGELIKQEILHVTDRERVVLQATKKIPLDQLLEIHSSVKNALTDESVDVLTLTDSVQFKVLKVN